MPVYLVGMCVMRVSLRRISHAGFAILLFIFGAQEISTKLVRKRFLPQGEIAHLVMPRPKLMRIMRRWTFYVMCPCALSVIVKHHRIDILQNTHKPASVPFLPCLNPNCFELINDLCPNMKRAKTLIWHHWP